ncbi:MAG: hypothetical protein AABZ08_11135 [Planctomycetota bacterium]
MIPNTRTAWLARLASFAFVLSIGCQQNPSPESTVPFAAASPVDAAKRLHALHLKRDYRSLTPLIIPEAAADTVAVLVAVDEVIDAGRALKSIAEAKYGGPVAEAGHLTAMQNNLGLFSRDVEFFSQNFKGDRAHVTLQEGQHVPLVHAEFVFRSGTWLYVPEKSSKPLAWELHLLASGLSEVGKQVKGGLSVLGFIDAFEAQITPQVVRVMRTGDTRAVVARSGDDAGQ